MQPDPKDPMARYTETYTIPAPLAKTAAACRYAIHANRWKVLRDDGWAFFVRDRRDIVSALMSYPVKFAVFVREQEDSADTLVELHGATFGFGPIPKMRLKSKTAQLRAEIDQALGAVEVEAEDKED